MRYHFTLVTMGIFKKDKGEDDKDVEKREHLCTVGRNVNWWNHYKKRMMLLKKLKIELSYDPAILFLGIRPKELKTGLQRYLCSHVHCGIIHNNQEAETT